jgi:hypothetical protein
MMQPLSIVQYAKSGFWFYRAYYLSLATLGKIVILPACSATLPPI